MIYSVHFALIFQKFYDILTTGVIMMQKDIKYSYFYDKFEIVHRSEPRTYQMPPHTHNAIEIYLNLTNLPNAMLGSMLLPLDPNVLLIIPSYCIHQFTQDDGKSYERYILTINTSWLDCIMDEHADIEYLKDSEKPIIIALSDERKTELIHRFENCLSCSNNDTFLKMSYFFDIMAYLDRLYADISSRKIKSVKPRVSGTRKIVMEMIEYINDHLYDNIKIQTVADEFFISPDYASKIFKKYTNSPIGSYITTQRITHAKQMLRSGSSVIETQQKTGYQSYEHFFRIFKKSTGMTPKEYKTLYCTLKE